jgi:nucleoid DNA-binding protein
MAATKAEKPLSKTGLVEALANATDFDRKQVKELLDVLDEVVAKELGRKGPGIFILPGLIKITKLNKPAVKAGTKPNPFKPGEMMEVKARPARNVVKLRPLKKLKEMV